MHWYLAIVGWWYYNPYQYLVYTLIIQMFLAGLYDGKRAGRSRDDIINMYTWLPFGMIPTSENITYIHTNRKEQTITGIQYSRRCLRCLTWNSREYSCKGVVWEIEYYLVAREYNVRGILSLLSDKFTVIIYCKLIANWIKLPKTWFNWINPIMNIISHLIQSGVQEPNLKYYLENYFNIA